MVTKKSETTSVFHWIKNNWQFATLSLGIVYIMFIIGLNFYQKSLYPKLISTSPENHEKGVNVNSNIKFDFDRKINEKDFSIRIIPTIKNVTIDSTDNILSVIPPELSTNTVYSVELFYRKNKLIEFKFATEGTGVLSIMGYEITHSSDIYDIFVAENTVVAHIRKEPYDKNKKLTEDFLQNEYSNKYEDLRITWIAPLPEDELSWEDLTKENPDGAP